MFRTLAANPESVEPFRFRPRSSGLNQRHRFHHQLRRQSTETLSQLMGILVQTDRQLAFQQNGTGVQTFLHRHHTDTGLLISLEQGPLDRSGSPPAGQQ